MKFLLKIVEGPNKGAEVALPEGVAVTLGKGEDCDIVLADATLPGEPLSLTATPDGVLVGRVAPNAPQDATPLAPFHVVERGASAFAVGPADAPWGELVWAESEVSAGALSRPDGEGATSAPLPDAAAREDARPPKRRRGCLGCFAALILLLLALAALGWWLAPASAKEAVCSRLARISRLARFARYPRDSRTTSASSDYTPPLSPLAALAARYNLAVVGDDKLVGDFATRAERLAATAEAYAAKPGVELDFCDDESLRTAAEDTLALLGEANLRVVAATNRVVALAGAASDLRRVIDALRADLPRLRDVNVAGVAGKVEVRSTKDEVRSMEEGEEVRSKEGDENSTNTSSFVLRTSYFPPPSLPVCGILTTPYPCLVLKNGSRVMEGTPMGEWTVAKIGADSVTLTNAERSVEWKP